MLAKEASGFTGFTHLFHAHRLFRPSYDLRPAARFSESTHLASRMSTPARKRLIRDFKKLKNVR